jgi:hypothetical protein
MVYVDFLRSTAWDYRISVLEQLEHGVDVV